MKLDFTNPPAHLFIKEAQGIFIFGKLQSTPSVNCFLAIVNTPVSYQCSFHGSSGSISITNIVYYIPFNLYI